MSNKTILQMKSVNFSYEGAVWQLQGIELGVGGGELVGVIGPNGAGKSTLLKLGAGILRPNAGEVLLNGNNIRRLPRRTVARQLGYLPQNVYSSFDYRVEEVVAMGRFAYLSGVGFLQATDLDQVGRAMEITETKQLRHRRVCQLSGGEHRRVLLASVLAQQPQVLLLDEPTAGLDLHHQTAFFRLLVNLTKEGMAVLVVTHDLNLAGQFCRRLVFLREGEIARQGRVEEVICVEFLAEVYKDKVFVGSHPVNKRPIALPLAEEGG